MCFLGGLEKNIFYDGSVNFVCSCFSSCSSFSISRWFSLLAEVTFASAAVFTLSAEVTFTSAAAFALLAEVTFASAAAFSLSAEVAFTSAAVFTLLAEVTFTSAAAFTLLAEVAFHSAAVFTLSAEVRNCAAAFFNEKEILELRMMPRTPDEKEFNNSRDEQAGKCAFLRLLLCNNQPPCQAEDPASAQFH